MKKLNTPTHVFPGKKLIPVVLLSALTAVYLHFILPYLFNVTASLALAPEGIITANSNQLYYIFQVSPKYFALTTP